MGIHSLVNHTTQQKVQNNQYEFPYHYLPEFDGDYIKPTRYWGWCIQYLGRLHLIYEHVKDLRFNTFLDVGCGDGRLINLLSKNIKGENHFYGIDYSGRPIALAQALNNAPNIKFEVIDVFNEQLSSLFDVVSIIEVLEHIEPNRLKEFVENSSNFLKPDGHFIVTVPSTNLALRSRHYQHFTQSNICSTLENSGLKVIKSFYIDSRSRVMEQLYRILHNQFFILNHPTLIKKIFDYYLRNHLYADEKSGEGIFVLCKKI